MRINLLAGVFWMFCQTIMGQSRFAVSAISPAMLRNADQVVRQYDLKFEVLNIGEAIETEHRVVTLLNAQGVLENDPVFWYDQIVKIENIEGAVYDASGKLIRKIGKKEVIDQKAFEHFVNDSRLKRLQFPRLSFPYTVEYTVVTKHNGLMHYPVFIPQNSSRVFG